MMSETTSPGLCVPAPNSSTAGMHRRRSSDPLPALSEGAAASDLAVTAPPASARRPAPGAPNSFAPIASCRSVVSIPHMLDERSGNRTPRSGLDTPDLLDLESFRVEDGSENKATRDRSALMGSVLLENPETETRWYFKHFLGQAHQNFLVVIVDERGHGGKELTVLSVLPETDERGTHKLRVIFWRQTGSERMLLNWSKGKAVDPKKIVNEFGYVVIDKKCPEVRDPALQKDLLVLEEQEGAVNFKIGVLYCKPGQRTDDEMFSNEHGSKAFDEFVALLGTRIEQMGWTGFRGGLDTRGGSTGTHAVHAVEFGKEIMFHVSTLLPYSKDNKQQVERKRHLGNDICNIIFQDDCSTPFFPEMIKSQFNHVFAVVSRDEAAGAYHLRVFNKNSLPEYGPSLPNPNVFTDPAELRHFLIVKLMNAEKAALSSPLSTFANKKQRTIGLLLQGIHQAFAGGKSLVTPRSPGRSRSRRALQASESFRTQGQAIKVNKIAAGAAPTSTLSSLTSGNEPWTPVCVTSTFPHRIFCGDSWGEHVVVGTQQGIFRIPIARHAEGELHVVQLFDKSVLARQLIVDEMDSVLYLRTVKTSSDLDGPAASADKNAVVYAVPLDELAHLTSALNKKALKKFLLPNSKGAHAIAVDTSISASPKGSVKKYCKLAVAVGKRLSTFQFVPKNPANVPGMGSGGTYVRMCESVCADNITTLSLTHLPNAVASQLCVGLTNGEFYIVDALLGSCTPVALAALHVDAVHTIAISNEAADEDEGMGADGGSSDASGDDGGSSAKTEFLVCYNQVAEFKNSDGKDSRGYSVKWYSKPHGVACVHPFLLGFTEDTIQVVTLLNGSLVKVIAMPEVTFLTNKKGVFFSTASDNEGKFSVFKISEELLSSKSSVEDSIGKLPSHLAAGNLYARKLSVAPGGVPADD